MVDSALGPPLSGAPYPGAPDTYAEAARDGVDLRPMRWGMPDVVGALLVALLVPMFVLSAVLQAGAPRTGAVVLLLSLTLPWFGFGLWPLISTRLRGNGARIDLGFSLRRSDLIWGVAGGVACLGLGQLASMVTQHFFGDFDSAAGDALSQTDGSRWLVYSFALCAVVGAPMFEELCFRGLAFAAIAKSVARRGLRPVPWATLGSALLFALVHLEPVRIPVLLTIGLVLSGLRAHTGRVGASIVAHSFNNLAAVLVIVMSAS